MSSVESPKISSKSSCRRRLTPQTKQKQNEDFFELFATNNGEYAAACALDFAHPPLFYDTFALRDSEGHEAVMQTWPYFRGRQSREALQRGEDVPVASCWNGMGQ